MRTSREDVPLSSRGPAIYYGYCGRTKKFRMMDLTDYVANMQEGVTRMMDDAQSSYREMATYGAWEYEVLDGCRRAGGVGPRAVDPRLLRAA